MLFAIYALSTDASGLQRFSACPNLAKGQWNDMEITIKNHRYTVKINGRQTTEFQNPRNDVIAEAPGPRLPLKARGLSKSEHPLSGYIGVQAHTSHTAFHNIRIKQL